MHRLIAALLLLAAPGLAQVSEDDEYVHLGFIREMHRGVGLVLIDLEPTLAPLASCILDSHEPLLLRSLHREEPSYLRILAPEQILDAEGRSLLVCRLYGSAELTLANPRLGDRVAIDPAGLELVRRCHDERASLTRAVGDAPEFHSALRAMQGARSRASRTIIGFGDTTVRLGEAEPLAIELVVPLQFEPERHQVERFPLPADLRISGEATPLLLDADAPTSSSLWDLELANLRTGTRARLSFDWSCPRRKRM